MEFLIHLMQARYFLGIGWLLRVFASQAWYQFEQPEDWEFAALAIKARLIFEVGVLRDLENVKEL
jgi:hypothetical protein